MKNTTTMTTISNLCDEIMIDILSRLIIQDLSPCRFVCKSWCNIIKDPVFIDTHHSRVNQEDPSFIIIHEIKAPRSRVEELFVVDNKSMTTGLMAKPFLSNLPVEVAANFFTVGSCNGLLCLRYKMQRQYYFIVNPITKEMVSLPIAPEAREPKFQYRFIQPGSYGFAYDATTKTYKVVRTWYFYRHIEEFPVLVFDMLTIGSEKWRRRELLDASISTDETAVFVNNALHWKTTNRQLGSHICALDVEAETFTSFKFPRVENDAKYVSLGTIKGCLVFLSEIPGGELHVWVMKDYGLDELWTKKCIVCLNRSPDFWYSRDWYGLKTLRTMNNGSTLLCDGECLSYFDFEKKEYQVINVQGLSSRESGGIPGVVAHVGSLISPKSIVAGKEITSRKPSNDWKEVRDSEVGHSFGIWY